MSGIVRPSHMDPGEVIMQNNKTRKKDISSYTENSEYRRIACEFPKILNNARNSIINFAQSASINNNYFLTKGNMFQ